MKNKSIYSITPFRRMTALFLTAVMLLGLVPFRGTSLFEGQTVKAAEISLSNTPLSNPKTTEDGVTTWDCVYFGNYVQSNAEGATPEPIKWRVLSVDGDDVFLLADNYLDNKQYHETREDVTWETSSLRTWLNETFLNTAFTAEEQAAIRDTEVTNDDNTLYATSGGNDTTDKVFLPSLKDMTNTRYGFSSMNTRIAYGYNKITGEFTDWTWLLRSPGENNASVAVVNYDGFLNYSGRPVNAVNSVVRPALHINRQSLNVWKYAGKVDSEGNIIAQWDCVYFGNYIQSNAVGAAPEPIKWRVLSVDGDDVFLLADKSLEMKAYNGMYTGVTWETSTLRTWLNGTFLDTAFTEDEQASILDTEVSNDGNPIHGTSGGNGTRDKVFLLSIAEVMNPYYGFISAVSETNTRKGERTAYAGGASENWWLRSPGLNGKYAAYVSVTGNVDSDGGYVDKNLAVRPALHINLQSLSVRNYAGTVDSEGNVWKLDPIITVGAQTGTVTYGAGGSTTYEIENIYFDDPVFSPEVVWDGTAPQGVTPTFNEGNTQLTLTVSAGTDAGTYRFQVMSGETKSAEATLTINKADVDGITTAVSDITKTAYLARNYTTKEAIVEYAGLPSQVRVSLTGGGTAILPITWATNTPYDAKGTSYDVIGTLTGNDNINVGDVTKSVTVTVTPVIVPNPTFGDISVIKDVGKPAATANDLGTNVLPTSDRVQVNTGGFIQVVDYVIDWSGTLDMTAVNNHAIFTGEVSYPNAPAWATLPSTTTVTRKVTVRDKTPTTVTVTAPINITYGESLRYSTATTSDRVTDATFTYQYGGTLSDGNGTPYNSTVKPTEPGTYTVTAILTSGTHMGTSEPKWFTISKKNLNWATEGVAGRKVYDGTAVATAATQPTLGGIINNDAVQVQNGTVRFASADAGEGIAVTASNYSITGSDAWKYNEPSDQPAFGNGTISPKEITFTIEPMEGQTYTGSALTPDVAVKDGTTTLTLNTHYTVSYSNNTNAGTANVTITGKGNYEGSTGSATFIINRIDYTGEKMVDKNVLSNTVSEGVTVKLPELPDGAVYGTASVTSENGLVTDTPIVSGTTLTFHTVAKEDNTTDTITIPVTGATNYNDYEVTVTVTAIAAYATLSGNVTGYRDIALSGTQQVEVIFTGDTFATTLGGNWITNLPAGLTQSVERINDVTARITLSGIPTETSSERIAVTIPSGALVANSSNSISAKTDDSARFDIKEATYTLTFDGTPDSFAELTYGYTTGSSVTYTVKNTGNQTLNNITAAISAGSDYFTAGTPSTTSLAPNATTTVTVESKTGLDAATLPYNGTLKITWTGGNGQTGIEQALSQMVNKADYTGIKTATAIVRSGQITTNATLALPTLPSGASYAASGTVGGTTALISGHSVSGTTLTFSTTNQDDATSDTITIPVTGATNYNDYEVTVTVTATATAIATYATLSGDVTGYRGIALTGKQQVEVILTGDTFSTTLGGNWITNLPVGLTQTVERINDVTARITLSGIPTETSSERIAVTIPSGALTANSSISISAMTADTAKYDIKDATYSLTFDGTPGSFAELTYGYTTGSSVTYTIKNTGNQTLNNITAAISAGGDYFTASTPSTTSLAPNATVTVTVGSKTGLDAAALPYNGTLKITWTGGDGQTGIEQALSQMVNKADYTGTKTATAIVRSGQTTTNATLALPTLPAGASYAASGTVGGTTALISGHNVSGTTLTYSTTSQEDSTTGTITIPVTDATNYKNYDVVVTITARNKKSVIIRGVTVADKTYDGTVVTKSGTPVAYNGTTDVDVSDYDYQWQKEGGDILAEAPKDAGNYRLIVSVPDSNSDYCGSQEINFTIRKAAVTITADDKTATAGNPVPIFTYTTAGLASGESLKTKPTISCTPDMSKVGTYAITPIGAEVPDNGNYEDTITYVNGMLTVKTAGNEFIAVSDITGIPETATVGTDLTLSGTVTPGGATNKEIQWTVRSEGTTGATITNGKLKTTGSGQLVITATIINGMSMTENYTKDFTIKVSYPVKKGSTYTISGYNYKVTSINNNKKEVAFVGLTAAKMKTATEVKITNTVIIKGITMKVTAVGKEALKNNAKVKTVKLANNVQTIDTKAFYKCRALKSVTIGTGLKTMGSKVFCNDTKLKTITIRSTKLTKVGAKAFYKVKATVKVPASKRSAYKRLLKGSLKITK